MAKDRLTGYLSTPTERIINVNMDYEQAENRPSINNVTVQGDKTGADYGLQNALVYDVEPTPGSDNAMTSGGIYSALQGLDTGVSDVLVDGRSVVGGGVAEIETDDFVRNANFDETVEALEEEISRKASIEYVDDGLMEAYEDAVREASEEVLHKQGMPNGLATLTSAGKVPSEQLPSYVDDVIEAWPVSGAEELSSGWFSDTQGGAAITPEAGKIYILMTDTANYVANMEFRWGGTQYVQLYSGGSIPDQSYNPLSREAQSGIAVAEAIAEIDIPTVPTNVSAFTNDANYGHAELDITELTDLEEWAIHNDQGYVIIRIRNDRVELDGVGRGAQLLTEDEFAAVATSGSYNDLSDRPTIPTVPTDLADLTNNGQDPYAHMSDVQGGGGDFALIEIEVTTFAEAVALLHAGKAVGFNTNDVNSEPWVGYVVGYDSTATNRNIYCIRKEFETDRLLYGRFTTSNLTVSVPISFRNWSTIAVLNSSGTSYTAGTGIDITNDEISVDNTIALKSEVQAKQDTLVSGTNLKTVNGNSLLGSGDVEIANYDEDDNTVLFGIFASDGNSSVFAGNTDGSGFEAVIGETVFNLITDTDIDQAYDGTSANAQSGIAVAQAISTKADLVPSAVNGEVLITDADGQPQSSGTDLATLLSDVEAGKEAFMLKDFTQTISAEIPYCTEDIANTSIAKITIDLDVIDPTGELGNAYAAASLAKFEVYDAATNGNRINCWPVCMFSEGGQKKLSLRFMCAGTQRQTAKRITGAILLKHR